MNPSASWQVLENIKIFAFARSRIPYSLQGIRLGRYATYVSVSLTRGRYPGPQILRQYLKLTL